MPQPTAGFNCQVWDASQGMSVRSVTGTIAADPGTLTDALIPPTLAVDCHCWDTIFVAADIAGGTAPSVTIEPLFYDSHAADGSRYRRIAVGALPGVDTVATPASQVATLANGATMAELMVFGHPQVFLRVSTVANATATTGYTLVAMPGRIRPGFDKVR